MRLLARVLILLLPAAFLVGLSTPAQARDPLGANDWTCRTTAQRPVPVILVHGTFGDRSSLLDRLSSSIKSRGFCVYSLDYGTRATGPIEQSAAELDAFVNRVLSSTGARKVSLVGHSQGGMMPRYWMKFLGGSNKVDDMIGLAPSNHGTYNSQLLAIAGVFCQSCVQQASDSEFLANLNAGDETPGPASFTNITTRYDVVVVPHTSGYLSGPNTTNVTIQDKCWFDLADHVGIPLNGPAVRMVLNALERPGPLDPNFRPSCLL